MKSERFFLILNAAVVYGVYGLAQFDADWMTLAFVLQAELWWAIKDYEKLLEDE